MHQRTLATGFVDRESIGMRNDVDHLPAAQQDELERVKQQEKAGEVAEEQDPRD